LDDYLGSLAQGRSPEAGRETLTRDQQVMEAVYLGLRQTEGINAADFETRFSEDCFSRFKDPLAELTAEGLLEYVPGRIRLSDRGMRFMDHVVNRLLG